MNTANELTWQATAAANILEARKKRGRLSSRKTRAGCITCKSRRIKCDQTRPECAKCTTSGRECEGYLDLPSPKLNKKNTNSLIGLQLSHALGLADCDRRTFDYFLTWTAPRISGVLDKDFWCRQVLQVAQGEPFVRDAILAISILYEHPQFLASFHNPKVTDNLEEPTDPAFLGSESHMALGSATPASVSHPKINKFHAIAIGHYNRSMRRLSESLTDGKVTPLLTLLSCMLFICIETIRDNASAVLALFKHGAKLIRQLDFASRAHAKNLLTNLKDKFIRLSLNAAMAGHPEVLEFQNGPTGNESYSITSLSSARTSLYKLMLDSHAVIRDSVFTSGTEDCLPRMESDDNNSGTNAVLDLPSGITHSDIMPVRILERQEQCQHQLRTWYDEFQNMGFSKHLETSYSLMMHYHLFYIWLANCLDPFESRIDDYKSHFQQIVRLGDLFLQQGTERQTFIYDSEIIAPLYFTATKCRVPSVRRKALDLLKKAPKKEGTFGGSTSAELAARIIAIEEDGLFQSGSHQPSFSFDDTILPPDSSRIHGFEVVVNRPARRYDIRVTRFSPLEDNRRGTAVFDYPV